MQVVSRYPLLEPPETKGSYLYVQVQPGRCVALSNVHLPSDEPGPTMIRRGKPVEQIVATEEKVRLPYIQAATRRCCRRWPSRASRSFLLGDFNAPSHLDYTAEVVGTRDYVKYVVDWPVSKAVEAAGFTDSWRAVYPDPLESLGLTWWAARPKVDGWNPGPNAPQDRIDFIYSAGPADGDGRPARRRAGRPGGDLRRRPVADRPSRRHDDVRGDAGAAPGDGRGVAAGGDRGADCHGLLQGRGRRGAGACRRALWRDAGRRAREPGRCRGSRGERLGRHRDAGARAPATTRCCWSARTTRSRPAPRSGCRSPGRSPSSRRTAPPTPPASRSS